MDVGKENHARIMRERKERIKIPYVQSTEKANKNFTKIIHYFFILVLHQCNNHDKSIKKYENTADPR